MSQDLSGLTRELREEKCPRRVLDEVERRISQSAPRRFRWALPFAVAVIVLVTCFFVWQGRTGRTAPQQAKGSMPPQSNPAQIASQTESALNLMGSVLIDAGVRSERIIVAQAVPPLRDSIEIARNQIIKNTDL
jgi:hypothetical protein